MFDGRVKVATANSLADAYLRHGDDFHSVPAQSVNQAEGKSWEDVPSGTASMFGAK